MKLSNGYGSIHKLSGNRRRPWRARVTTGWNEDGKQLYFTVGYYESRSKALQGLAEYHKDPYSFKMGKLLFKDVFEKLMIEKESRTGKKKVGIESLNKDRWAFTYCNSIENMSFEDVKLMHLQKVVNDISEDLKATKRRVKSLLNQIYDFGIANDICTKNYVKYLDVDLSQESDMHIPFTKEEKQRLWDNVDTVPYTDIILVYIYTGFRPSELIKIECETGVNLNSDIPYLEGGSKTEAGKHRKVPIHPKVLPIVTKWYNMGNKYLFTNDGKRFTYGTWEYRFQKVMETLGMNHRPHDPRHTFATDLDNKNANQVCRHRLLGHADKNITDKVYTHKDLEELKKTIDLLE